MLLADSICEARAGTEAITCPRRAAVLTGKVMTVLMGDDKASVRNATGVVSLTRPLLWALRPHTLSPMWLGDIFQMTLTLKRVDCVKEIVTATEWVGLVRRVEEGRRAGFLGRATCAFGRQRSGDSSGNVRSPPASS